MLIETDDGKYLEVLGTEQLSYAEVTSGAEEFTVCVRITGGPEVRVEAPLVFQNRLEDYPIDGVNDDVLGVAYHTQK